MQQSQRKPRPHLKLLLQWRSWWQPYVLSVSDLVDAVLAGEEAEELAGEEQEAVELEAVEWEVVKLEVVELEGAATPADMSGTCHGSALRGTQRRRNDGAWE
jgi:hypothetical protein